LSSWHLASSSECVASVGACSDHAAGGLQGLLLRSAAPGREQRSRRSWRRSSSGSGLAGNCPNVLCFIWVVVWHPWKVVATAG
jgi:hypothetical protein